MGEENLTADLDMIRFIRRKRMHGFGLHFMLGNSLRNLSARLAFSRPLSKETLPDAIAGDPTDIKMIEDKWHYIEHLHKRDLF